jgi:multiple sugar transport system ATP-binding protein
MGSSLQIEAISKSFGAGPVLDDVSLDVAPGEFVSLVGSSGCGKSTLLRIIAGLETQNSGSIRIGDVAVDHLGPRARNIAMVFQSYALYPHMTAFDNIALPLVVGRLSLPERLPLLRYLSPRRRRVERAIADDVQNVAALLRIETLLSRKPGQLSGGQRQRVALARAMVRHPSVFLMDEPLSNLDAQLRVHMRDELVDLHKRLGATFIYVTHDQVEAMTMSTRVAMMHQGRIAQVGRPQDLYERPETLDVARFIGSPSINVLPGRVGPGGRISVGGHQISAGVSLAAGSAVSVAFRPETVRLTSTGIDSDAIGARIRRLEHHGSEILAYLDVKAGEIVESAVARMPTHGDGASHVLSSGTDVSISLDPTRLHVFGGDGRRIATSTEGLSSSRVAARERAAAAS